MREAGVSIAEASGHAWMKCRHLIASNFAMLPAFMALGANAASTFAADTTEIIPIHGGGLGPVPVGGGRNLITNYLHVYLVDDFGDYSLVFSVNQNLGILSYTITNHTTSVSWGESFYAAPGSYPIPLPSTSGYYTVEFVLPGGSEYEGSFVL